MTKPWEETWEQTEPGNDVINGSFTEVFLREDRLTLACAAPEMARMLLALHGEHGNRHTFDWAYWFTEIEAVLEKAGVLKPGDT